MSHIIELNEGNFQAEILNTKKLAVVDFGADWCQPCKKIHPIMSELADEYGEKLKVGYVDVGHQKTIAQQYAVMSVPQLVFFKNGRPVGTIIGLVSKPKIQEKIENHI